jgi:AbrB family looped-hinge helix DNA binding protein
MTAVKGKVVEGGRIIVPAAFRKSMGLSKGDTVFMELDGDELRIRPARSALRRIQAKLRALAPGEGFAFDELIAERRAEAERE